MKDPYEVVFENEIGISLPINIVIEMVENGEIILSELVQEGGGFTYTLRFK